MREIDQPQDAEQQADAERRQRIEAAEAERIDRYLQQVDQRVLLGFFGLSGGSGSRRSRNRRA